VNITRTWLEARRSSRRTWILEVTLYLAASSRSVMSEPQKLRAFMQRLRTWLIASLNSLHLRLTSKELTSRL